MSKELRPAAGPQDLRSSSRWPESRKVLLFLVLTRALLNIPALIGAHWFPGSDWSPFASTVSHLICGAPQHLPCIWARWDAENYLVIAVNGYSVPQNVVFFPAYPLLIRSVAFGFPSLMAWSGIFISNLTFILASLFLWEQIKLEINESIAWRTIVALSLFPTSFFFSAIYSESLFLLLSVLVYVLSARKQYLLAGLCISLASLTRPNGLLLVVIPLAKILLSRPWSWRQFFSTALISGIGSGIYGAYLWMTHGSPLAFALAERQGFGVSIGLDWRHVWGEYARVIAALSRGHGYFTSLDLMSVSLFVVLAIGGFFFLKKGPAVYLMASVLAFLPWRASVEFHSMPRYVLGFFPGFIVLAILLSRYPGLERLVWVTSAAALLLLTGVFASGHWVA